VLRRSRPRYVEPPVEEPTDFDDFFDDYDYDDDIPRRKPGGRPVTVLLLLFVLVFLGIGVLRVVGYDGNEITVGALALTPYVAPGGLLLALISFGLRRRLIAFCVLVIALSMVVLLLPRFMVNNQPEADGERVRVMSATLSYGQANPADVVRAVLDNEVDVLALPGLTQAELALLDAAGLTGRLPQRVLDPTGGSVIASRYPLRQIVLVEDIGLAQPAAVVDLPGRDDLEILAVNVRSATTDLAGWQRDLRRLPPPNPERLRVLAGAFNAGFDHATFRVILDPGYSDAAEQAGKGLIPTRTGQGPPITIDHILVDRRAAVTRFAVLTLTNSDHDAIFADLTLP
jgi:endonuclease/exonuclease/phosphatase family metal-dependent hydrolase